ncbi:MFS transporter [Agrobacterium larrymoorei]|uniref:MFS transporter n=1 Tax=Agrobacterium larrymoorei TaxID=160699 RepID=UPI0015748E67|nr:MFS transporter [Agrobacterium larrymoorei]NTJ44215.1 MFS transporter [Agrobacterium larrymoorei]
MLGPALLIMTAIAVISDTMLLPYYPQLFQTRFDAVSPVIVGAYLATISLTVMLSLPAWVTVAKRIGTLPMLIATQTAAAIFSIGCYITASLVDFWLLSLAVVAVKASYLLMYPYVIAMQPKAKHASTIGALAVIVHFGGIVGAAFGGHLVETFDYAMPYLAMAAGDIAQAVICIALVLLGRKASDDAISLSDDPVQSEKGEVETDSRQFLLLLCVMFCFYFGFYIALPFTAVWWRTIATASSQIQAGLVFAIPGFVALTLLAWSHAVKEPGPAWKRNDFGLMLTAIGLAIQSLPNAVCVVIGRIIYGVGLYKVTVGLDVLFFERARTSRYASGFSLVNIAKNSGVMAAALVSGSVTQHFGQGMPFLIASICVAATLLIYRLCLKPSLAPASPLIQPALQQQ